MKDFLGFSLRKRMELVLEVKRKFENCLIKKLNLKKVPAPLFVEAESGIQDDLNGIEKAVEFKIDSIGEKRFQIVHSLAKWKRLALREMQLEVGEGIITDMLAIRPQEDIKNSSIHSVLVDQWDWERVISKDERNIYYLKKAVKKIYSCLKKTEIYFSKMLNYESVLPKEIKFIYSDDLYKAFPNLSPKKREREIVKRYGAVFIIGIGYPLPDGKPHDGRAPDYDDWVTLGENGKRGLNGDIIIWNPVLEDAFEISSMGIRVDKDSLKTQLKMQGLEKRLLFPWHKLLMKGELPLSIGGGIGQSRVAMYMLRRKHIGEVQVSAWPEKVKGFSNKGSLLMV